MFCSICLAFSSDNPFTYGLSDWKHIYQCISEHENSKIYNQCYEVYFMHSQQRDVGSLLMCNQMSQQRKEVKKNRQVLERIIDVCKLIGKHNEAASLLEDLTLS